MLSLQAVSSFAAILLASYWLAKRTLWEYLMCTSTVVRELSQLGTSRELREKRGIAVICGGSVAGLLAARVCTDHFAKVIVIEPDEWTHTLEARLPWTSSATREVSSDSGDNHQRYSTLVHQRTRVYQFTSLHVYYVIVLRVLRALFPATIDSEAAHFGALIQNFCFNPRFSGWGFRQPYSEYRKRGEEYPKTIYSSRRTLEGLVRSLVHKACADLVHLQGVATHFRLGADGSVDTVGYRASDGSTTELRCDMVIDCTGNTQAGLKLLLTALPRESAAHLVGLRESYDPRMFYVTHEFPKPLNFEKDLEHITITYDLLGPLNGHPQRLDSSTHPWILSYFPDPTIDNHGVILGRRENGNIVLVVGGWDSWLPLTLDQIEAYAREATSHNGPVPEFFFDILRLLRPVASQSTSFQARIRSCSRISYGNVPSGILPRNFVAIGDSNMRLNPIFGEGVSKCAVGVTTLDGVLRSLHLGPKDPGFGETFFKRLAARTNHLWDNSRFTDYGRDTTVPVAGETLSVGCYFRWYKLQLYKVQAKNDAVASAVWHSLNFLAPSLVVVTPSIAIRVLWEGLFPTQPTSPPVASAS